MIVAIHNSQHYDMKFIFRELVKNKKINNIRIIGKSIESFIAVETQRFKFVDTRCHMLSSLDKLTNNLIQHGEHHFVELRREFPLDSHFNLMLGKGSFCYEYIDDMRKLLEGCPSHDKFFSALKNKNISDDEYTTVQNIFSEFGITTIGQLLELYVKQDCLILCDVVNHYRGMVRRNYGLEALSYYSSPALSMDAALKFTKVEIQLLTDSTMYMFVEQGNNISIIQHFQ